GGEALTQALLVGEEVAPVRLAELRAEGLAVLVDVVVARGRAADRLLGGEELPQREVHRAGRRGRSDRKAGGDGRLGSRVRRSNRGQGEKRERDQEYGCLHER